MAAPFHTDASEPAASTAFDAAAYVQQALQLLGLNVPPEQLPGIVEQFDRIHRIAQPVLDFPLPDNLEAAPQFEP